MLRRVVLVAIFVVSALPTASEAETRIRFAHAVNYPTGSEWGPGPAPIGAVAGDFNRDGRTDIVICDWFGESPLLLENRGRAKFGRATPITEGHDIDSLAVADLNRDKRLDLVGSTGSEIVVLLGRGNGSFRIAGTYPTRTNAQVQAIVLDVDDDKKFDIASTTPDGVQILLGKGDGTFEEGPLNEILGLLSGLAAARLDRDRFIDLLLLDARPLGQEVIALKGLGDGRFAPRGRGAVGSGPEAVIAGDFDNDRISDVVTADSFNSTVTVLISDGRGGFTTGTMYDGDDGPVSAAVADFDRDGNLDFVETAVASSVANVFAGDGKGRFKLAASLPTTRQPQTPVVADFDNDGRPDIAVAGPGQLSLLRNVS